MTASQIMTCLVLAGACLFIYVYHIRTRRFDASDRPRVTCSRQFAILDWYLKISSLLITVVALNWTHPILLQIHDQLGFRVIGIALAGLAILLFVWAMRTLDSQYTPAHMSHLPSKIVTSGPYRFIRHPVYASNLLLLVALTLASGSSLLLLNLAILITYYVPTIASEEAAIAGEHAGYREYMGRTGRIFPKLR